MNTEKNVRELTPSQYFENLKERKNKVTDADLVKFYDNAMVMLNKYRITGQVEGMKKLIFHIETVEKERELVKMGIDTFVYVEDVEEYIDDVSQNTIKIIELDRYERDIPDEVVDVVAKTKHLFTRFYVVFTDYTGRVERKVAQERRDRDPILFGTFKMIGSQDPPEKFYFLADWEDVYCDLTLAKMVSEVKEANGKDIAITISTPTEMAELKQQLDSLVWENGTYKVKEQKKAKKNFFSNISLFNKGKSK